MKLNKRLVLLTIAFVGIPVLIFLNVVSATPDSQPFYNFKRLYEKTQLRFNNDPNTRLDYLLSLLDKRFNELSYIANNQPKYLYSTSLRYTTTAGQATELVVNNRMENRKDEVKKKLESHLAAVNNLKNTYPRADEEIKFIVDAQNYLKTYLDQISAL